MIRSMTGYGRSEAVVNGRLISAEIRSVNHRYFEFSARVPRRYGFLEEKLKSYLQTVIGRGKVEVAVSLEQPQNQPVHVKVDHSLADGYLCAIRELVQKYSLRDDVSALSLSKFPDVLTVEHDNEDEDAVWKDVLSVLQDALERFVAMRQREGERLRSDIEKKLNHILEMVSVIEERSPQTVREYREKLEAKVRALLEDRNIDEQRILTETAVFADKVAVDEETVRLRSHIEELRAMFDAQEAIGRKMDFIVQEMNREANTTGSKCQDVSITKLVVEIKSEIEKIREQVQNIE